MCLGSDMSLLLQGLSKLYMCEHECIYYNCLKTTFSPRFDKCEASELKEGFLKFLEICMNRLKRISPRTPDDRIKTYTSNVRNQQLMAKNPRVNVSNFIITGRHI